MLVHIPDKQNEVGNESPVPTGWETFLVNKAPRAPGSSLEVSNLGYFRQLPPSATNVAFAQTPHIFGAPFFANAVGHQGGVDFVVCWREAEFVLDNDKKMDDFASAFEAVLRYLAEQNDGNQLMEDGNSLSFADSRKAVDDKRPLSP
ncbi:hypothetical protein QFC19_000568 [Naganishia cerealis]|uniref:Uncharacterized protein n=1 Tax=Naganishia cerealis TaxID=610337 RepID=A0ACC2WM81_9TREE|nr:hypothetical protein QFC19_000568 [Naganishia cerealis]